MSWGRDIRLKDLLMIGAPVDGGLEPQLLDPTRQAIRGQVAARIDAYVPEWTNRRADDAGVALVRAYGTVAEAVNLRLNHAPRKLALEHLELAGVRALQARPARATLGIEVAPRAGAPLDLPAGSAFLVPGESVVLETLQPCTAVPGALRSVGALSDGWTVSDQAGDLGALAPFGPRPRVPAELWLGIDSPVAPAGLLSLAFELVASRDRATFAALATVSPATPPTLRWEAMTAAGAGELPVERDDTAGLSQSGVLALRVDTPAPWSPRTLPGRPDGAPLYWLRARLITNDYPDDRRLARVTLNGVTAIAARSVRGEVLEPLQRPALGRSRFRLAQVPVVPGSLLIDVADASADVFGAERADDLSSVWTEVDDLASAGPEDRVFLLDAAEGIVTFGDGIDGRAVPDGYRNVVARRYAVGGGTSGLPAAGDTIGPQRSIPNLGGATVLAITTGADAESPAALVLRGPAEICSRGRAVAPGDYATLALAADGVDVARAHCLPGTDPLTGGIVPGLVGVIVVPKATAGAGQPTPSAAALRAVAEHLAREVGVIGAEVVAAAPRYREIAAQAVLVARAGSDLGAAGSAARDIIDRWLDPLRGGGDGTGWPFGETVRWDALTRLLLASLPELTAVSRLAFRIDGRRLAACADAPLEPGELTWPGLHIIEVVAEERTS